MAIEDLAELVGVPVRTVRYYITEDLIPGPGTRGKGTVYTEEHLLRLKLIRLLVEQRVPLAEIRQRLSSLSLRDVQALLGEDDRRARERESSFGVQSPRDYISGLLGRARADRAHPYRPEPAQTRRMADPAGSDSTSPSPTDAPSGESWQRLPLAPGVELHVRADAWDRYRKLIDQLLRSARAPGGQRYQ